MKIILKNFLRNNICNLTIASILHFRPDANIYCLCQYKKSPDDYLSQEALNLPYFNIFYRRSQYTDLGASVANKYNNLFFTEGYNQIFDFFRTEHKDDKNEPMLMLAEDHFFTSGATLTELEGTDCDLAFAGWGAGANGSILFLHPEKVKNIFPIPERWDTIEHTLYADVVKKIPKDRLHQLTTRNELDYKGDGVYSNNYDEIKSEMIRTGILKT